jgi:cysteine desulfurase
MRLTMRTAKAPVSSVKTNSRVPVYLDCNATSPVEPQVAREVIRYLTTEFGNAGSRTHEYGNTAKRAVQHAREQVAAVVEASPDEVVFTSGATESNNLAILGLTDHGTTVNRKHIISTAIEHKAVLEPLEFLAKRGFEVTLLRPTAGGWVDAEELRQALRSDTLLVSVMHANNETGVIQPIPEMLRVVADHPTYFHIDAAQGFGKELESLRDKRIDLISISGHKIYGPKGIGALVVRRRGYQRAPLSPLTFGGGQERGLRPGTLPVPLAVGIGLAAELAIKHHAERLQTCRRFRETVLAQLSPLAPTINGDQSRTLPHVLNLSFPGLDSEAVIVALKHLVAFSNGSACTSHKYEPSHVLLAMGLSKAEVQRAVRLSWCHMSEDVEWSKVVQTIRSLS